MAADKKHTDNKKQSPNTGNPAQPDGKLAGQYFNEYAAGHQDAVNKTIHYICIPPLIFGLFGLIWAIPFPYLGFLGQYNGYFNWASFVIAIAIYYYLKLSPLISYIVLLILLGFSYIIIELLAWQATGGFPMWVICFICALPSFNAIIYGNGREATAAKPRLLFLSLAVAPAYFLHLLFKKLFVKY